MKLLDKMERKFGRYAVRNLSAYIIALYVAGYLMEIFAPGILNYLTLEPYYILRGQVWRLVTWIIVPPSSLDIFTVIMLFFYYSVGKNLEQTWGAFRYNVYIFSGVLVMTIGSFALYLLLGGNVMFGTLFTTYHINMSIFLAFATTYPDVRVLLYFIIPIKVKWLGIFYAVVLGLNFLSANWVGKLVLVLSLFNFIVYFLCSRNVRRYSYKNQKRQWEFKKAVHTPPVNNQKTSRENGPITRHKCAVCGRTELDGDHLEFRFCSKCNGNYEYCQDHLFTHEHVR
ncbi:MAG: hypothetical protein ACI4EI_01200 [Muricoprocola sp.]